jgi:type 1 fimbria pilin
MRNRIMVFMAGIAAALVMATSALATPVTLTFSGTVTSTGRTVNGSLTLDPSTFQSVLTDGTTYNSPRGYHYYPGSCNNCVMQSSLRDGPALDEGAYSRFA